MEREARIKNKVVVRCPKCGKLVNVNDILHQTSPTQMYIFSRFVIVRCPHCGYVFEPVTEQYIYETERNIPTDRSNNLSNNCNSSILRSNNKNGTSCSDN